MDSQRITESSQHVTRSGRALSQVLSAALCDVYAHRDGYELSEYSENGFMVVVAEDAYLSIVFFQMTEPLGWDGLELLWRGDGRRE